MQIVPARTRRLVQLTIVADDADDLSRRAANLSRLGTATAATGSSPSAMDKATAFGLSSMFGPGGAAHRRGIGLQWPGRSERIDRRVPGVLRPGRVKPRKLGHAVVSPDIETTMQFLVQGLGFQVSDYIENEGVFLRCSEDHHNMLVLQTQAAGGPAGSNHRIEVSYRLALLPPATTARQPQATSTSSRRPRHPPQPPTGLNHPTL